MAIIALKAWYLDKYEPIREVVKRPHDLRLSRNSLLKSGLRADFLDDSLDIQGSFWFQRYLEGDTVEFYIEGSGGYAISNIDLLSHEIYFTKRDINAWLDPIIYLSYQTRFADASDALRAVLLEAIETFNRRSRLPLILEETPRAEGNPTRLSDSQFRKIRKSLLFIADTTAISQVESEILLDPLVCVELGYAIECKRSGQILLASLDRPELKGKVPFDVPQHQQFSFTDPAGLRRTFPPLLESLLQKFNLTP
ncbi:hypothetical protein V0288_24715 [Pannus brasiliensis CCIBt3594]|uniref:Uncharacterized protein n=1 Tax=Pannus brasiliensis CCIBt3594 TaxID=1427578 RepID=A0AAW9QTE0_9CHRO